MMTTMMIMVLMDEGDDDNRMSSEWCFLVVTSLASTEGESPDSAACGLNKAEFNLTAL